MATDYTSRDFSSVKSALIERARETIPEWSSTTQSDFAALLLDLWAYSADIQNYYVDRAFTEAFLSTATQRGSVHALARIMGYSPNQRASATANVTLSNSSAANITVPAGTMFLVPSTSSTSAVYFTSTVDTVAVAATTTAVAVKEGRTVSETLTTNFDGVPGSTFVLSELNVTPDSVVVTVGQSVFNYTARLTDVSASTPAFTIVTDSAENTRILFGNGINGRVPTPGSSISVSYRVGSGASGNVATNAITVQDSPITYLSIASSTAGVGGIDPESIASIKKNAPAVRRTQDRAVTLNDYSSLINGYQGVVKQHVLTSTATGVVTVHFVGVPDYPNYEDLPIATTSLDLTTDFGSAGVDINSDLATFLSDRSMLGVSVAQINTVVTMDDVYVDFNGLTVAPGYYQVDVQDAITAAIKNMFTWDSVEFDQTVYLSDIMATAKAVDGVVNVSISNVSGTALGGLAVDYVSTASTTTTLFLPCLRAVSYAGVSGGIA